MARGSNTVADVEAPEVDVEAPESEEVDVVATESGEGDKAKEPKAKKEPARGDMPEGFVTPVQLAQVLSKPYKDDEGNELHYHTTKDGGHEVKPQMVYSYIKNASTADPFPLTTVKDSIGKDRPGVKLEDGLAWWLRKNERVAGRAANAAEKLAKKAAAAEKKAAEAAVVEGAETVTAGEVTEAE